MSRLTATGATEPTPCRPNFIGSGKKKAAYTRQAGFSTLQHEQMALNYVCHHGRIQRAEVMELCHLTHDQAFKLLQRIAGEGLLLKQRNARASLYTLGSTKKA